MTKNQLLRTRGFFPLLQNQWSGECDLIVLCVVYHQKSIKSEAYRKYVWIYPALKHHQVQIKSSYHLESQLPVCHVLSSPLIVSYRRGFRTWQDQTKLHREKSIVRASQRAKSIMAYSPVRTRHEILTTRIASLVFWPTSLLIRPGNL